MSRRIAGFLCMAKTCVLFGSNLIRLVFVQELSCIISACAVAWTVVTDLCVAATDPHIYCGVDVRAYSGGDVPHVVVPNSRCKYRALWDS